MTGSLTLSPLENKVTIAWKNDDQATVCGKGQFFCPTHHIFSLTLLYSKGRFLEQNRGAKWCHFMQKQSGQCK